MIPLPKIELILSAELKNHMTVHDGEMSSITWQQYPLMSLLRAVWHTLSCPEAVFGQGVVFLLRLHCSQMEDKKTLRGTWVAFHTTAAPEFSGGRSARAY